MDKVSTGIVGLDKVLGGGYLASRPTVIKGDPGTGKTIYCLLFAIEALRSGKSVCFVTCDESPEDLLSNIKTISDGLTDEQIKNLRFIDYRINPEEDAIGDYELTPLLLRIQTSLQQNGVVVIDSLHTLLELVTHSSHYVTLQRLLNWHKQNGVLLLMTMGMVPNKFGDKFEEYYADCVIELSQKMKSNYLMTRYLRVKKMRRTKHGTNAYPFMLNSNGVSLLPITSIELDRLDINQRQSTGIAELDTMLGGGYLCGSNMLIAGETGTAKTLLATKMTQTAVANGTKTMFVSFEQSDANLIATSTSIGIDFEAMIEQRGLILKAVNAQEMGLEEHLIRIIDLCEQHQPQFVVLDSVTSLLDIGSAADVKSLLSRFCSYLTNRRITACFVELIHDQISDDNPICISSLIDTMIRLRRIETNGEFYRLMHVVKSRGSATSNQVREFYVSDTGFRIERPYIGEGHMVFGSEKSQQMILNDERFNKLSNKLAEINKTLELLESYENKGIDERLLTVERAKIDLLEAKYNAESDLATIVRVKQSNEESRN